MRNIFLLYIYLLKKQIDAKEDNIFIIALRIETEHKIQKFSLVSLPTQCQFFCHCHNVWNSDICGVWPSGSYTRAKYGDIVSHKRQQAILPIFLKKHHHRNNKRLFIRKQ